MKTIVVGLGVAQIGLSSLIGVAAARSKKDSVYYSSCKDMTTVTDSPRNCPSFR